MDRPVGKTEKIRLTLTLSIKISLNFFLGGAIVPLSSKESL